MIYYDLLYNISRNGEEITARGEYTKELLDQTLSLDKYNLTCTDFSRPISKVKSYLYKELPWYMSGERDNSYIVPHASMWKDIENRDGTANSNYGNLIYYRMTDGLPPFEWARQNLIKDKNTRKALMLYNSRDFNYMDNKDYICSQVQHFFIRKNELSCRIYLRSSDAIFGLTYNMPWWSIVHQDLRLKLLESYPKLALGKILVHIGSAHIYSRHYKLVEKMLNEKWEEYFIELKKPIELGLKPKEYEGQIQEYFKIKEAESQII